MTAPDPESPNTVGPFAYTGIPHGGGYKSPWLKMVRNDKSTDMRDGFVVQGPDFDISKMTEEDSLVSLIKYTIATCAFVSRDNPGWFSIGAVTVHPVTDRTCSNCDDVRFLKIEFRKIQTA